MSQERSAGGGGIGVAALLGVAFVVLKLCSVIDWPWLWVLSPFWIPVAIVLAILLVVGVLAAFSAAMGKEVIRRRF